MPGSRGALADPKAAEPPETGRERALRVRRSLRGGARQRPGSRPWSFPSSHGGAEGQGDGRELPAAPRAGARLELRSRDAIEWSPHCHRRLPLISDVRAWNAPPGSIGGRPDCPPLPADPGQGLSVRLETRGDELPSHDRASSAAPSAGPATRHTRPLSSCRPALPWALGHRAASGGGDGQSAGNHTRFLELQWAGAARARCPRPPRPPRAGDRASNPEGAFPPPVRARGGATNAQRRPWLLWGDQPFPPTVSLSSAERDF